MDVCNLITCTLARASHGPVSVWPRILCLTPPCCLWHSAELCCSCSYFVPFRPGLRRMNVIQIRIEIGPSSSWRLSRGWVLRRDGLTSWGVWL